MTGRLALNRSNTPAPAAGSVGRRFGSIPKSGLVGLYTPYTSNDPQLFVTINREKVKAIGVPLAQITSALGTYMGSSYVNDFDFNNRSYRVYVQADQSFRRNSKDLREFYVRSDGGQMIPLDNLVSITETSGPQVIYHYNIFRSAEIQVGIHHLDGVMKRISDEVRLVACRAQVQARMRECVAVAGLQ